MVKLHRKVDETSCLVIVCERLGILFLIIVIVLPR